MKRILENEIYRLEYNTLPEKKRQKYLQKLLNQKDVK